MVKPNGVGPEGFPARLDAAIRASALTAKALAERLGTDPAEVSRWRNGRTTPGGGFLLRLPTILGCDGHWLMTGEGSIDGCRIERQRVEAARAVLEGRLDHLLHNMIGAAAV